MRRIVEIKLNNDLIFALCDDGTLWVLSPDDEKGILLWKQLPDIPQPKNEKYY